MFHEKTKVHGYGKSFRLVYGLRFTVLKCLYMQSMFTGYLTCQIGVPIEL